MNYNRIEQFVENKLHELNDKLTYHSISHTLDDVLPAVIRLAEKSNVLGNNLVLLKTAALYHDLGYLEGYEENESVGARMAEESLSQFDYSEEQIEIVKQLILSTKMPQNPVTLLEKILCDADLDSLGRDDFLTKSNHLFNELNHYSQIITLYDWLAMQLQFIKNHSYHTMHARSLRDEGKKKNIALLEQRLINLI